MSTLETPKIRRSPRVKIAKSTGKRAAMEPVPMSPAEPIISPNQPSAKKSRLRKSPEIANEVQNPKNSRKIKQRMKILEPTASFVFEQRQRRMEDWTAHPSLQRKSSIQAMRMKTFNTPKPMEGPGIGTRRGSPASNVETMRREKEKLEQELSKEKEEKQKLQAEQLQKQQEIKTLLENAERERQRVLELERMLRENSTKSDISTEEIVSPGKSQPSTKKSPKTGKKQSIKSPGAGSNGKRTPTPKKRSPRKLAEKRLMEQQAAIEHRMGTRRHEMKEKANAELEEARQREILEKELKGSVAKRFRGKSKLQLCHEFFPKSRQQIHGPAEHDAIRRTLRKAMAEFHPDRSTHLPTLRERVEADLIFQHLKNAYDEITRFINLGC